MRTQSDSSLSYFFRNCLYLLPLVVLPAIWSALIPTIATWIVGSIEYNTPTELIIRMFAGLNPDTPFVVDDFFNDVFIYTSLIGNYSVWWLWLIAGVFTVFSLCCVFSAVDRHMRLGARQYGRLVNSINETLLPMTAYIIFAILAYVFIQVLCSAFIFLFYSINLPQIVALVLSFCMLLLSALLLLSLLTMTCLTIPCRLMDGYKFNIALSYSCQLIGKRFWKTFVRLLLFLIVSFTILFGLRLAFELSHLIAFDVLDSVFTGVCIAFLLELLPVFFTRTYFTVTNSQRRDISQQLF